MSAETIEWLQKNVLIGDCDVHGNPWHSGDVKVTVGDSTNLYPAAVPVKRVRQLFDFPVIASPVQFELPAIVEDGKETQAAQLITTDRVAVAHGRTGALFGVFADSYVIHPYEAALLENIAKIVSESAGDLHIDSAGLLAGGAEAWLSISTTGLLTTPQGVEYFPHIIASTSHNGTLATTYKAVNTMIVCDNTRANALSEKTPGMKIKHTKYSAGKLTEVANALGLLNVASDNFAAEVALLCAQPVTDAQWHEFVKVIAPITDDTKKAGVTRAEALRELLTSLYVGDPRCEQWHGTAFGALQAVNVFDLWERGTRGAADGLDKMVKADRVRREAITGKLDTREQERANALALILATA